MKNDAIHDAGVAFLRLRFRAIWKQFFEFGCKFSATVERCFRRYPRRCRGFLGSPVVGDLALTFCSDSLRLFSFANAILGAVVAFCCSFWDSFWTMF